MEGRSEFIKFLAKHEPSHKVNVREDIYFGFPKYLIDNFLEETLYLTVDFNAIRKRIHI